MTQGIILSLGSVNADFQVRVDKKPGTTTTMLGHDFLRLSGGKAANVAYLARKLGVQASLIAHVGKDDLQEQALGSLQEMGVELRYVRALEQETTGVSMIAVPEDGKKQIILAANANDVWQHEDGDEVEKAIHQAPEGSVLVVDYEIAPFIVERAIVVAHKKGFLVLLDPSPADRVNQELYPQINYMVPDASETEDLTGIKPDTVSRAKEAALRLVELGIAHAVVKMEDGGCVAATQEEILHIPAIQVEVVDATGAGDAFAGALAVALLEKRPLKEAACFASAASQAAVTGYGSQPAYPDREGIGFYYKQLITQTKKL
ncbi:ribokinase [Pontibacter sp. SGAir0037]|uniref:ribokinase n=1 Tax=Pontibacter sp. SGAir0037 TaxID=2571030 RepID=UPI00143D999C|nr:ribokinase [Pontibacter sp. SGAir0037]